MLWQPLRHSVWGCPWRQPHHSAGPETSPKLLSSTNRTDHIVLGQLHWFLFVSKDNGAGFGFKALNGLGPGYLRNCFFPYEPIQKFSSCNLLGETKSDDFFQHSAQGGMCRLLHTILLLHTYFKWCWDLLFFCFCWLCIVLIICCFIMFYIVHCYVALFLSLQATFGLLFRDWQDTQLYYE